MGNDQQVQSAANAASLVYAEGGLIINTPGAWTMRSKIGKTSWEAAMWSKEGQADRFNKIIEHVSLRYKPGDSIFDYGCGTGAFSDVVFESLEDPIYTGYDWSDGMIKRAKKEHPESKTRKFWHLEPGGKYEHIVICGTFNLKHGWDKQKTNTILARLLPRTRKSLILSCYMGDNEEQCIIYDPNDFMDLVPRPLFSYPRDNDLFVIFEK